MRLIGLKRAYGCVTHSSGQIPLSVLPKDVQTVSHIDEAHIEDESGCLQRQESKVNVRKYITTRCSSI